jgi:hypothetical protein
MKTNVRLWSYLSQFLEWDIFELQVLEIIKSHIYYDNIFLKNRAVYETVIKNMIYYTTHALCILVN